MLLSGVLLLFINTNLQKNNFSYKNYWDANTVNDLLILDQDLSWLNLNSEDLYSYSSYNLKFNEQPILDLVSDTFIFHNSVPNVKLYYPEPFIASPTFIHEDIWFMHIVIYQYWLWFFFIFMIIFFFLAFLVTVRWCNVRNRPVRETRGVSRSKCGDLITATIPVSWAISIIVHESTDAIEISDGFGSTEMAVGIRAYQWGWEYYYPKDLSLSFSNLKSPYRFGNSLHYQKDSITSKQKNFFKTNSIISSYTDNSNVPLSLTGSDAFNDTNLTALSSLPFGINRLAASKSTNLITSQKLTNFKENINHLKVQNTPFLFFENYLLPSSFSSNPWLNTNQLNKLPLISIFRYSSNLSNFKNFKLLLDYRAESDAKVGTGNYELTPTSPALNFFKIENKLGLQKPSSYVATGLTKNLLSFNSTETENSPSAPHFKVFLVSLRETVSKLSQTSQTSVSTVADQDFKVWDSLELLEDALYDFPSNLNSGNTGELNSKSLFFRNFIQEKSQSTFINSLPYADISIREGFLPLLQSNSRGLDVSSRLAVSADYFKNLDTILDSFYIYKSNALVLNNSLKTMGYSVTGFPTIVSYMDAIKSWSGSNSLFFFNTRTVQSSIDFKSQSFLSDRFLKLAPDYSNASSFKNFYLSEQAFVKVFKNNIEDERSGSSAKLLSKMNTPLLFINNNAPSLLNIFSKESLNFVQPSTFSISKVVTPNNNITGLSDFFVFSFPFSLSSESDVSRYIWFDWYSLRNVRVTKAVDTSVFNLYGSKQYNYSFTKDPKAQLINRLDNFFTKYSHARKLFIPSNIYTPYFYNKYREWPVRFFSNLSSSELSSSKAVVNSVDSFKILLSNQGWLWLGLFNSMFSSPFSSNYSNTLAASRPFYQNPSINSSQLEAISHLLDILARRELFFKLLDTNEGLYETPLSRRASISNPVLLTIKLSFSDNNSYGFLNNIVNTDLSDTSTTFKGSLKSQYQPLRKGIVNMIRIQADKAVAMPTDTRLQILAVSKDIIHSWSIPSAGIKIDCIPGYSSHRVAIFTLSGIYWGQCMEICGRFHHWMPIVVYFMRRDLFCLWCTHFIFNNAEDSFISKTNDFITPDSNLTPSVDFNIWSSEL